MTDINELFLTEEEKEACVNLIKEMRKKKTFAVDFLGCVRVKAKTKEEAKEIFWNWVGDLQDKSLADWSETVTESPYFEYDGAEEE